MDLKHPTKRAERQVEVRQICKGDDTACRTDTSEAASIRG